MGVLARLSRGDAYQYEIVSSLLPGLQMGEGAVYPVLRRFRNEALVSTYLVETESGPARKYYRLEPKGSDVLAQMKKEQRSLYTQLDALIAGGAA
jgi:PadR family transcriptional regulator PadR